MARPNSPLILDPGAPITPEVAFALVLRERRTAMGLTQSDMEGDTSLDRTFISKLELAQSQVCLRNILEIAQKLQMRPGELLDQVADRLQESSAKPKRGRKS